MRDPMVNCPHWPCRDVVEFGGPKPDPDDNVFCPACQPSTSETGEARPLYGTIETSFPRHAPGTPNDCAVER